LASIGSICRVHLIYHDHEVSFYDIIFAIFSLFRVSIEVLLSIYMTFQVDLFSRKSKRRMESFYHSIIQSKDTVSWNFVLQKINETKQYEYNASNIFVINRTSLLSFGTSFLSLTVLFVQLINQQFQSQYDMTYHG